MKALPVVTLASVVLAAVSVAEAHPPETPVVAPAGTPPVTVSAPGTAVAAPAVVPATTPATPQPAPGDTAPVSHRGSGFALGVQLQRMQDDLGFGATLSTPLYLGESLRFTLGANVAWLENAGSSFPDDRWLTYYQGRFVVEVGQRLSGTPIRLYAFAGVEAIILSSGLSSTGFNVGGLGGFGFEFYMPQGRNDGPVSYYIEIGGAGSGAVADQLPATPLVGNGFLIAVGVHLHP